jgi:hypothetical protein
MSIKTEVFIIGDEMYFNDWHVYQIGDEWEVSSVNRSEQFILLEDAIKYCLEN